jgi:hypothetical protein
VDPPPFATAFHAVDYSNVETVDYFNADTITRWIT